jgi:ribosome-binding factor A
MNLNPDKAPTKRQTQVGLELRSIAQDFFQRESSGASLITVTRAEVTANLKSATIYITVLPESKEAAALDFAKRMRSDLRESVKKKLPIKVIPFFDIEIDYGEKNRVHISELLRKENRNSNK